MLNKEETAKIFKYYMGMYFVKPDVPVYQYFKKKFQEAEEDNIQTIYCFDNRYMLRQCGMAYLDYKNTYQQHTKLDSYDLLNSFLHLKEDIYSNVFYDLPKSPLIIYHSSGYTDNKRLVPLITHVYNYRQLKGYKTLILSEVNIFRALLTKEKASPILDISKIQSKVEDYEVEL